MTPEEALLSHDWQYGATTGLLLRHDCYAVTCLTDLRQLACDSDKCQLLFEHGCTHLPVTTCDVHVRHIEVRSTVAKRALKCNIQASTAIYDF